MSGLQERHSAQTRSYISVSTIGDLVDAAAADSEDLGLVFPDARATYPELAAITDRYAQALIALGVRAGDKVGILMPNQLEFIAGLVGALKIGAIVVPINGRFRAFELGTVIAHADISVLLTCAGPVGTVDYPALLAEVLHPEGQDPYDLSLDSVPFLRTLVDLGGEASGFLPGQRMLAGADNIPLADVRTRQQRVKVRDVALIMYTSGTTSQPKGCMLTHEALVRHASNVAHSRFRLTAQDRFWDPLPLFHIGGLVPMLGCFANRARYCHAGHFDPDTALRMLQEHQVTVAYPAFETIWLQVLNHPQFSPAALKSLRLVQNIAVPEKLVQMQERLPSAVEVSSYGATECSSNLTLPSPEDDYETRMFTLGTPLEGMEVKVVDPQTREERPVGEVGELAFRGYSLFSAYYKDPERTADCIDAEGWFYSGDLASVDERGRLRYEGRLKDMLKVGGENVSALEVEGYLARHPAVDIAQVVSAPDAKYTEVPAAYIQLKPGTAATEGELIQFCVGQIASYKVPRYIRLVTEWPMSGTKIQKFVLREWIAGELRDRGITGGSTAPGARHARGDELVNGRGPE